MDWRRNRYMQELERLIWDGEITEEEAEDMMEKWDEGYELACDEAREAANDR